MMIDSDPSRPKQENKLGDESKRSIFGSPTTTVIACQIISGALVFVIFGNVLGNIGWKPTLMSLLVLQGILAAVAGLFLGLSRWWAPVQVLIPATAAWALRTEVPAWVWLLLFVATLLVYWNSARGGVPLYLSNRTTWRALSGLLPKQKGIKFIDLGGGLGGTTLYLARTNPDVEFYAVETAPIPYAVLWFRGKLSGLKNLHVGFGDFWHLNFTDYDVLYAFLSPVPMPKLYDKARAEMKTGAVLVSNSFDVPGHEADEIIELDDKRSTRLHIWRVSGRG